MLQGVLHVGGVQVPLHLLGFLEASCNPATLATGCDKKTNTLVTHVKHVGQHTPNVLSFLPNPSNMNFRAGGLNCAKLLDLLGKQLLNQ